MVIVFMEKWFNQVGNIERCDLANPDAKLGTFPLCNVGLFESRLVECTSKLPSRHQDYSAASISALGERSIVP